jgi:hypothetical protein
MGDVTRSYNGLPKGVTLNALWTWPHPTLLLVQGRGASARLWRETYWTPITCYPLTSYRHEVSEASRYNPWQEVACLPTSSVEVVPSVGGKPVSSPFPDWQAANPRVILWHDSPFGGPGRRIQALGTLILAWV